MTLLLPYRVDLTPAPAGADGPPRYHRLRLTVGGDADALRAEPVSCARIAVRVPAVTDGTRVPVAVSTTVPRVRGSAQGTEWWVVPDTTDPAATVFACVPENPARFDGSWAIAFVLELDPGFEGTDVEITEITATGGGPAADRTNRVAANVLPAVDEKGRP